MFFPNNLLIFMLVNLLFIGCKGKQLIISRQHANMGLSGRIVDGMDYVLLVIQYG